MQDRLANRIAAAPKNSNYEKDINYTFQIPRCFWRILGVWPWLYHDTKLYEKFISIILLATFFFDLLFVFIPPILHVIYVERTVYRIMSYMGPLCHTFASLFKYYFLIQKATSMTPCIIRMEGDWKAVDNANDRDIMLKQASMGRTLIKTCAIFAYVGGILYMTVWNLLQKNKFSGGNVTTRTLSYPGYDRFVNTQLSPTFEIIQTLQYISGLLKYTITTASYSLVVICVTHIRGQIQIQMSRLENLVEETKQNSTDNTYFANIIERHAEILRIIEEGLNMLCLMQIVDSALLICFLANHCLLDIQDNDWISTIPYFILLVSFIYNLFIFNYTGETLSEEVGQIGQASYEINWYTLPPKKASFVVLMNIVSLQPPKLTGGKIFELSILTFGTVMKTSIVYLNLLRTFN